MPAVPAVPAVPALVRHYVHVTAALAGTSSIFPGTVVPQSLTGALVTITDADNASLAAASTAAALWNTYYPNSSLPPATVTTAVVDSFPGDTTVGLAYGWGCAGSDPRHMCGLITLQVLRGWEDLFVDIFFHEIGHAVIYASVSLADRALDISHHWNPAEPSEIFGPSVAFHPWVADYTIAAAGGGIACSTDADCDGVCAAVAGFQRVPGVCAAAPPAPPPAPPPAASPAGSAAAGGAGGGGGDAGGGSGDTAWAFAVGGAAGVLLLAGLVVATRRRKADDMRESLI
jgi:hypothetical protein